MNRRDFLVETRKMRFLEFYQAWKHEHFTQCQAASALGMSERNFRRYCVRFENEGEAGLEDKRKIVVPAHKAADEEVEALTCLYREKHSGWNVKHFHSWYVLGGGIRSYGWVKKQLQSFGLVERSPGRGKHRKRRERASCPGMMLHQDASTHQWVPGKLWDLVVTMDDANNEHYSMFFTDEEGTASSLQGVKDVIEAKGIFASLYTDRGAHYWSTPEAGGKVDKVNLTQFGEAMKSLRIHMIPAYSPEARGRSERAFGTHQGRLPQELSFAGITDMEAANRYLRDVYMPAYNKEFMKPCEGKPVFVPFVGPPLDELLCERYTRTVGKDNCVQFEGRKLQIPPDNYRYHYVKRDVTVIRKIDDSLAIFDGPRCLATFGKNGENLPMTACEAA